MALSDLDITLVILETITLDISLVSTATNGRHRDSSGNFVHELVSRLFSQIAGQRVSQLNRPAPLVTAYLRLENRRASHSDTARHTFFPLLFRPSRAFIAYRDIDITINSRKLIERRSTTHVEMEFLNDVRVNERPFYGAHATAVEQLELPRVHERYLMGSVVIIVNILRRTSAMTPIRTGRRRMFTLRGGGEGRGEGDVGALRVRERPSRHRRLFVRRMCPLGRSEPSEHYARNALQSG